MFMLSQKNSGSQETQFMFKSVIFLRCGIPIILLKYIIKGYNLSMHNFNVATVDCSYMFQPLKCLKGKG